MSDNFGGSRPHSTLCSALMGMPQLCTCGGAFRGARLAAVGVTFSVSAMHASAASMAGPRKRRALAR